MVWSMRDPVFPSRIKLVLTLALLAIVTAFGITYITGRTREAADRAAAARAVEEARARGAEIPP